MVKFWFVAPKLAKLGLDKLGLDKLGLEKLGLGKFTPLSSSASLSFNDELTVSSAGKASRLIPAKAVAGSLAWGAVLRLAVLGFAIFGTLFITLCLLCSALG